MSFLDPRVWLLGMVLMLSSYAGGRWQQWRSDEHAQLVEQAKAVAAVRKREDQWLSDAQSVQEVHDDEIRAVAAERDAALQRLSHRPVGRLAAAATCTADGSGATGAQLSGPDAAAFARLAADADTVAADLRACQAWIGVVKGKAGEK